MARFAVRSAAALAAQLLLVMAALARRLSRYAAVGVMYSVIVLNRYAVIFHTQDLGSTPSSGMFEAMKSIEAATLTRAAAPAGIS